MPRIFGGAMNLKKKLEDVGFYADEWLVVQVKNLITRPNGKIKAALLTGKPGVGKTFLTKSLAKVLGGYYDYQLCHNWLTWEELTEDIHIGRVAAGVNKPGEAYLKGAVLRAAETSSEGVSVLCIDEIDKAPEKVETSLLRFLQDGVIHTQNGVVRANLENLIVFLTSNEKRKLHGATMRRLQRIQMIFLEPEAELKILQNKTSAPVGLIKLVIRLAWVVRGASSDAPSLQELENLIFDLLQSPTQYLGRIAEQWLCKDEDGKEALAKAAPRLGAALAREINK